MVWHITSLWNPPICNLQNTNFVFRIKITKLCKFHVYNQRHKEKIAVYRARSNCSRCIRHSACSCPSVATLCPAKRPHNTSTLSRPLHVKCFTLHYSQIILPICVMTSEIQQRRTNHRTLHCIVISRVPKTRRANCWFCGLLSTNIIPILKCGLVQYRRIFHFRCFSPWVFRLKPVFYPWNVTCCTRQVRKQSNKDENSIIFTYVPCILINIKVFPSTNAQSDSLKNNINFALKSTLTLRRLMSYIYIYIYIYIWSTHSWCF